MKTGGNLAGAAAVFVTCCVCSPALADQAGTCLGVVQPLARGAVPVAADFAPKACPASTDKTDADGSSLRYDSSIRALRATRDILPGETLAAVALDLPTVRPGDALVLIEQVGAVTVERRVTAVQAGRAGAPLFVKTADGAVFSAVAPGSRQ